MNPCRFKRLISLISLGLCPFQVLVASDIKLGELELIYTEDEIPIRYDGSLSTLMKDGEMHFFHSFGCRLETTMDRRSRHSWHKGTPMDPLKHHIRSTTDKEFWDYNGHYDEYDQKGIWILGMYACQNGDLLGITHAELNKKTKAGRMVRANQRFALGLGYSTDGGVSWTYCGEILRPADDRHNVGGGAFVIHDGYLQVYFNDVIPAGRGSPKQRLQTVARAKLSTVLEAAARGGVTPWFKYKDGHWEIPGLGGMPGEDIIPEREGANDLHVDAAYCTALEKYLLTVQGKGLLLLFSSPNGVNWAFEETVDQVDGKIVPYSSFVDWDGPSVDCNVVDDEFYLYFPRKAADHNIDYLYRRKITIE